MKEEKAGEMNELRNTASVIALGVSANLSKEGGSALQEFVSNKDVSVPEKEISLEELKRFSGK